MSIIEANYAGNIGAMEMFKFFQMATIEQKRLMREYIRQKNTSQAWDLVQQVTGMKLQRMN